MTILASQSTPSNCGEALYDLKTLLVSAGWTIDESGDGVSVYAASDVLTTPAIAAQPGAWFLVVSPLGASGPKFTIQNGSNNGQVDCFFSCYGVASSGNATTPATLTNGVQARSTSTAAMFMTNGTYRFWAAADNAAPYGAWWGCMPLGGGAVKGVQILAPLDQYTAGDTTPYTFVSSNTNHDLYASYLTQVGANLNDTLNLAYPPLTTSAITYSCFLPVNQAFFGGSQCLAATSSGGGFGTDPVTGNDALFPIMFARSLSSGLASWKGTTTWMRWKGTNRTNGDTATLSTSRDLIHMGDVVLPWDGSVPVL